MVARDFIVIFGDRGSFDGNLMVRNVRRFILVIYFGKGGSVSHTSFQEPQLGPVWTGREAILIF